MIRGVRSYRPYDYLELIDDEALKKLVIQLRPPRGGSSPEAEAAEALYYLLPDHSDDHRRRIAEVAGPGAALQIGKAYLGYYRSRVLNSRRIKKRLDHAISAAEELQRLGLTPLDFHLWGLDEHVPEALYEIGPGRIADALVALLKRSHLAGRGPGRPRDEGRKLLAVQVARQLRAAGVPVTAESGGTLSEVLGLLLGIECPDRLVKHAVRALEEG